MTGSSQGKSTTGGATGAVMLVNRTKSTSLSRRVWAHVRLVHPFPVATVVATSILVLFIAEHGTVDAELFLRVGFVVLMTQVPVGALNDYVDRGHDAVEQPYKPIPSGLVSPCVALAITILSLVALVVLAATFGLVATAVILIATAGGVVYDIWLKPTPFSVVGYFVGFMGLISWLWLVSGRFTLLFLTAYPAGVLLLTAAHLAQSFPDLESDRRLGQRGLATVLGVQRTFTMILAPYAAVLAGGLLLAALSYSALSLILLLGAGVLGLAAWRIGTHGGLCTEVRIRIFHVVAPGIGLLALGCLVAVGALA